MFNPAVNPSAIRTNTHDQIPDFEKATAMLDMLGMFDNFTFQVFDDNTDLKRPKLATMLHGQLDDYLAALTQANQLGGGVFVTINQTDLQGRSANNITAIRGVFVDFDTVDEGRVPRLIGLDLPPSMILETSKGKHHAYWLCDGLGLDEFKPLQQRLIAYFADQGADKAIHDLPRVMRLEGFYHCKLDSKKGLDGTPFLVRRAFTSDRYTAQEVRDFVQGLKMPEGFINPHKKIPLDQEQDYKHENTQQKTPDYFNPITTFEQAKAHAKGHWQAILGRLGYQVSNDPKAHTACPQCGGNDRFRFDNQDGNGSFICSQGTGATIAGDGFSFLADHIGLGNKTALERVIGALDQLSLSSHGQAGEAHEWGEMTPLAADSISYEEYPIDALPPMVSNAAKAIAYYTQCPDAMAAQCIIGAMSYLAQNHVNAPSINNPDGMPCSLFVLTEGQSGGRKSEAQRQAEKKIAECEKVQYLDFKAAHDQWLDGQVGLKPKDKTEYLETNPEPIDTSTIFNDATIEPIMGRFIEGTLKGAAWSTDESAQFFGGHTMKGDTMTGALGQFTRLFDSGSVERTRGKGNANGSGKAYDVRMTFNMLGQREVLFDALTDPVLRGQGFLPRFLLSRPESLAGTRLLTPERMAEKSYEDPRLKAYWARCEMLLKQHEAPCIFDDGRRVLEMTEAAQSIWIAFYNATETPQRKGDRYEYLRPFASRAGELATRLATVLAYFTDKTMIDVETMQGACRIVQHSLDEWARYADDDSNSESDAQKLITWILKNTDKNNRSIAYQLVQARCNPKSFRKKELFEMLLGELKTTHHIRFFNIGDARHIELNPMLFA